MKLKVFCGTPGDREVGFNKWFHEGITIHNVVASEDVLHIFYTEVVDKTKVQNSEWL